MHYKKILKHLESLEKESKKLEKQFKNHSLLKSKVWIYTKEDKQSFKILWEKYIELFDGLKKNISRSHYKKHFIFRDYNKLILHKYALVIYFDTILNLDKIFWEHSGFIRIFLEENFRKDYGYYAKYIYRPQYITVINTANIFLRPFERKIAPKIFTLLWTDKLTVKSDNRLAWDYQNMFFYVKNRIDIYLFKLLKKVWMVIARTKFSYRTQWLIQDKYVKEYLKIAKPWDIFLTRWNWNASNISIPGFWKHMSMYVWDGKIIEATWEWILVKNIEQLVEHNDYLWVFRTDFTQDKIQRVIQKAQKYIWTWYDFRFNFYSDKFLVCSELVLKSYSKDFWDDEGIDIQLEHIWLGITFPPNNFLELVRKRDYLEPIFFIDSIEKTWKNFISTPTQLLKSRKRPRFSFLLD